MKVSVPKDFGNTAKKPILPLVPEPIQAVKKEELTAVNLYSDPGDHASTQVKFTFKGLNGDSKSPREILHWRRDVDRALIGLDLTAGNSQYNMAKQFMGGSTMATFDASVLRYCTQHKADAMTHVAEAVRYHPAAGAAGHDAAVLANLQAALLAANNRDEITHLVEGHGINIVRDSLNDVVKVLLPNKTLQRVNQYLSREARKPKDMTVKQYIMYIFCINNEEIPCCPPNFNDAQKLSKDEIIDILLFGTPKSWQR